MAHAILSPSSAERWLNCTPSARLETQFPDRGSDAAGEGTHAHALGELLIRDKLGLPVSVLPEVRKQQFKRDLADLQAGKFYNSEMLDYCEDYAVFVMERFSEAQQRTPDAMIFLEEKLDLTLYVPESYGTTDVNIIADRILEIIDLKYGKGVPVFAEQNRQMMLYALGALERFEHLFDIETVRMTIHQPRIDNSSSWEISVDELKSWGQFELKARAQMAFEGVGDFVPGKHCQFCKAKPVCRAIHDYNMELAALEFKKPDLLNDDEVVDVLGKAKMFMDWLKAVKDHALHEAVFNEKKWPGLKVVAGRGNRYYTDPVEVLVALNQAGFVTSAIAKPLAPKPITELEKELGKADFQKYVGDMVKKQTGKPTLVPESDKRPPMNTAEAAKADFSDADAE